MIFTIEEARDILRIDGSDNDANATVNKLSLSVDEVRKMLESDMKFTKIKDITAFFGKTFATQAYSYDFAIYKAIKAKKEHPQRRRRKLQN